MAACQKLCYEDASCVAFYYHYEFSEKDAGIGVDILKNDCYNWKLVGNVKGDGTQQTAANYLHQDTCYIKNTGFTQNFDTTAATKGWMTFKAEDLDMQIAATINTNSMKVVMLSKGSYGTYGDAASFNKMYAEAISGKDEVIIQRECADCDASHKDIFYKRVRNLGYIHAYGLFMETWTIVDNQHECTATVLDSNCARIKGVTDFQLFSSLDDAIKDTNPWKYCPTADDPGAGFPSTCGPTAATPVINNWNGPKAGTKANANYRYSYHKYTVKDGVKNYKKTGLIFTRTATATADGKTEYELKPGAKSLYLD